MNKKQICKVAGFLLVLLVCVSYLTEVFMSKWTTVCYETAVPREFYKLDQNSIEVAIFGSSQVAQGISGMELYEKYGISAYSLGTAKQSMPATYTWLKECYKTQKIKVAVIDVASLYYPSVSETRYRQAFDNMKWSIDKWKAVYEHCQRDANADPFFSYVFKISKYHTRWDQLTEEDFTYDLDEQLVFRGNALYSDRIALDVNELAYDNDTPVDDLEMNSDELEYLLKFIEFCKEKDISVLLIKTPRVDWNITQHQQVWVLAQEQGVPYIDFSSMEMIQALQLDTANDFMDYRHLNISGAAKLSNYLGSYLKENYELTDFREVEGFDELNYDRYCERRLDSEMQMTDDIAEYIRYLDNDRYDVLIQLTADTTNLHIEELRDYLLSSGIVTDITAIDGLRFLCQINGGTCAYEEVEPRGFKHEGYLSDGIKYCLSTSFSTTDEPIVDIDFESYTFANHGINFLVYDNKNHMVVDRSTICYDTINNVPVLVKENPRRKLQ